MIKKVFLLLFCIYSLGASTEYEKVYEVYKKGDFKEALVSFESLVDKDGDYDAAYILGYMYEHGEGCSPDLKKSQKYYKISSNGYYWENKSNPGRNIEKEQKKLYETLYTSKDKETQETIKQYAQSLYNLKANKANYFLPISYRGEGKYPDTNGHESLNVETEFQFSIKYDFAANIFGLNETYSVSYTQKSFWQLYADSAYFRETNYNPELFMTLPMNMEYFKALRFSFAHQSNGRGGVEERSWNHLKGTFYFQTWFFFTELELFKDVGDLSYNPDLMDYMGHSKIQITLPYKKHILKLSSRNSFSNYRALQVSYSYPVFGSRDLFFYVKAFSGYGESLIDYDNKIDKFGLGFSISR